MLSSYIQGAMRRATYEILPDNEGFYGEIPGFRGVCANEDTLEKCREELQSVLEDWMLIKLRHNDNDLPVVDGLDLNVSVVAE